MNRKLQISLISLLNIIFIMLLITNNALKINTIFQIVIALSILLVSLNNFKNGDKLIGGLFLLASVLVTIMAL